MVDAVPEPSRPADDPVTAVLPAGVTAETVARRRRHRDPSHWTPLMPNVEALRVERDALRAENAALREQLAAEQDAANDAINELLRQLHETRADREDPPRRVYESGEEFVARMDEVRADLERGA